MVIKKKTILSAAYIETMRAKKKICPFKTLKPKTKMILTKPKMKMIFTTPNGSLYAKLYTDMSLHWTIGTVS